MVRVNVGLDEASPTYELRDWRSRRVVKSSAGAAFHGKMAGEARGA